MRDDFCAFILTHGRPDKVLTYRTLRRAGYCTARYSGRLRGCFQQ
ncbi:hypothetical protein [Escherichia coli]|nr:hypothetical protein [Escherichia coli]